MPPPVIYQTRKHSSKMRTIRCQWPSGGCLPGGCLRGGFCPSACWDTPHCLPGGYLPQCMLGYTPPPRGQNDTDADGKNPSKLHCHWHHHNCYIVPTVFTTFMNNGNIIPVLGVHLRFYLFTFPYFYCPIRIVITRPEFFFLFERVHTKHAPVV